MRGRGEGGSFFFPMSMLPAAHAKPAWSHLCGRQLLQPPALLISPDASHLQKLNYPRLLMPPPLEAAVSSYSSPPRRTIPDHVSAPGPIKEIPVVDRQGHVDAKPPDTATLPRPRFPFREPVFLIFLCRIREIVLKLRGEAMGEWRQDLVQSEGSVRQEAMKKGSALKSG